MLLIYNNQGRKKYGINKKIFIIESSGDWLAGKIASHERVIRFLRAAADG